MPCDVVYVLGYGSRWQDNEIRYSLRSIEKHLKGFRHIYVIGQLPKWLTGVIHIPFKDRGITKEHKILAKVLHACRDERISDPFLFMNDDHYLLSDYKAGEFPYYYSQSLANESIKYRKPGPYRNAVKNTAGILPHGNYFDIHCPILYHKQRFIDIMEAVGWRNDPYVIKSLYANLADVEGQQMDDSILACPASVEKYREWIKDRRWFSTGRQIDHEQMAILMNELYPEKSRFEI